MARVDSIDGSGFPLGFRAATGERRPSVLGTGGGREIYVVEARKLGGHQKEAVVREGEGGSAWRAMRANTSRARTWRRSRLDTSMPGCMAT